MELRSDGSSAHGGTGAKVRRPPLSALGVGEGWRYLVSALVFPDPLCPATGKAVSRYGAEEAGAGGGGGAAPV